jgi:hypothetical protein
VLKIYCDRHLDTNIMKYTFNELFRYIDIKFKFINNSNDANLVYAEIYGTDKQFVIHPSKLFWQNYKKVNSLPNSPLPHFNGLTYVYKNDVIASTFFLLSGYEELIQNRKDENDRFLYKYSNYTNDNIYNEPLVEYYRKYITKGLNGIGINCKLKNLFDSNYGLFLTHDVDGVNKYRNTLKSIIKILLMDPKYNLKDLIASKKNIKNDPYYKGFFYLINLSVKYKFKPVFFFIPVIRSKIDNLYNLKDKYIVKIIKYIRKFNYDIEVHGSSLSYDNDNFMKNDKKCIYSSIGVRQHYLKYNIMKTSQIQNKYFKYDTSLGFSDYIGFRRGTCLPFKLFDFNENISLDLFEIPLHVMDVTLRINMGLGLKKSRDDIIKIINLINKYNGIFTFLWHPGNCSDEWAIWTKNVYEPILSYLSKSGAIPLSSQDIINIIDDKKN